MVRESQTLVLCGPKQGVVGEEAGRASWASARVCPSSATQTCGGHLPNWAVGPAGTSGCRNGAS